MLSCLYKEKGTSGAVFYYYPKNGNYYDSLEIEPVSYTHLDVYKRQTRFSSITLDNMLCTNLLCVLNGPIFAGTY